jgi:bla regulator protein blaR1
MIGGLTNHLWQSTLFVVAAGLLAVACHKNRAQIRYWLWLSASLKFLVPFSLLVSLGSHLEWVPTSNKTATQAVSFTVVQITQPFSGSLSFAPSTPSTTHWFPIAILGLWLSGFGLIAFVRFKAWLRIRAAVRSSTRLKMPAEVEVRCSPGLLEPGVVGLLRPVLLLPAGIVESLTKPQLEAVLTHELCHIRRRDNLTAAIHMIVEAVFWFHPLVWWIGARLVEERERACDEEVLRLGTEPQVYAEGILKVCKFYVESPLTCVAGVTGHDLKKRIERIMRNHVGETLKTWKKLLLGTVGVTALAMMLIAGVLSSPRLRAQSPTVPQWQTAAGGKMAFDVASIKQNKSGNNPYANFPLEDGSAYSRNGGLLSVTDFPLSAYIGFAYKLTPSLSNAVDSQLPKWAATERFDIQARAEGNPTKDQMRLMMQSLLADRFKLAVHTETRQVPVFALVLVKPGKTGPRLRPYADDPPCATEGLLPNPAGTPPTKPEPVTEFPAVCFVLEAQQGPGGRMIIGSRNVTMQQIANDLPALPMSGLERSVLDQTGLSGNFDFTIEIDRSDAMSADATQPDDSGPTFSEALRDQLGLKLVPQKGPVDVLVIDHVEKPSEN